MSTPFFAPSPCPCGSGTDAPSCCRRWRTGTDPATAEELMRARYVAHIDRRDDFLLRTWHPRTRPLDMTFGIERWLGLRIVSVTDGGVDDETGSVTFEARFLEDGSEQVLATTSEFVRHRGRWVYLDDVA